MGIIQTIKAKLEQGHKRTVTARKNILMAILFRGLGVLIGFAYFPLSIEYLGVSKFGIFLTLTSIIDWFAELDIGIGNGLRNRLGESIAEEDDERAKGYVSTAYFAIGSIFSGLAIIFIPFCFVLPWVDWLNVEEAGMQGEIAILAMLIFAAFAVNFVSSMIYQIFYSLQRTAIVDFFQLLTKGSFLVIIIALMYFTEDSLLLFGGAKTLTFAFVPLIVGIFYFHRSFRAWKPSLRYVRRDYFKSLFSLGVQFFIIKIAMVIIHQTNNILIAGVVAPEEVTKYEAAYKYLSIFLMLFVILTNQLWVASLEAYKKGEMEWMKNTVWTVIKIWFGTVLLSVLMIIISPQVFSLWLQDEVDIPILLTVAVALSIALTNWVNLFNLILNGTGKIRVQMYAWILASVINIPLSIFFAKNLGLGTIGIVLGTICSMIPLIILSPIQVRKILLLRDKGIWGK